MSTDNINKSEIFSERLKGLRGGKSQVKFAKELGIKSPVTYFNYEKGRIPKPEILDKIAEKQGVTVDWLLGRKNAIPLSSDHGRFIEETELQTDNRTQRLMDKLRQQADFIRRAPEDFNAFKKQIDWFLEEYHKWCIDNFPNEKMRQRNESRTMLDEIQKKDGGGE